MATEGRTVLVSSHQMGEMSVAADHLLIIGEGRLLVDSETEAFQRDHEHDEIHVSTPDPQALRERIAGVGGSVRDIDATSFAVSGLDTPRSARWPCPRASHWTSLHRCDVPSRTRSWN
jgi:ABC-2 type transport system ATP-binding protein